MTGMRIRDERILEAMKQLNPIKIQLSNDSTLHAGHLEAPNTQSGVGFAGDTHYKLFIVSELFDGVSRIDRQRMVMNLLKDEFNSGLHALEIRAYSPNEV